MVAAFPLHSRVTRIDPARFTAPFPLRPYQEQATRDIITCYEQAGRTQTLAEMPTGSGKTAVDMALIQNWLHPEDRGLILLPTIDLTRQFYEEARRWFPHEYLGRVQAEHNELGRWLTIASIDTLANPLRRQEYLRAQGGQRCGLTIIDEGHLAVANKYLQQVLPEVEHPCGMRLTQTATPSRRDRQSLRRVAPHGTSVFVDPLDLIVQGYLCTVEPYKMPTDLNLAGLTLSGEVEEVEQCSPELLARLKRSNRYEVAYQSWLEVIEQKRTIIFADTLPDAYGFREYFIGKGVPCEVVSGKMGTTRREECYAAYKSGEMPVLISYRVLTTGIDLPCTEGLILGRFSLMGDDPPKEEHMQMLGRGTRNWIDPQTGEVKEKCVAVYLTDATHERIPIVMGLGYLPGTMSTPTRKRTLRARLLEDLGVQDEEQEERLSPFTISLHIERVRAEATSVFTGTGWIQHIDGSFSKVTSRGTLIAEREGMGTRYSVYLQGPHRRERLTKEPLVAEYALATGVQHVLREEGKEQMRRGALREEGKLPLTEGQITHLSHRKGLDLQDNWQQSMTQQDYLRIERLLQERETKKLFYLDIQYRTGVSPHFVGKKKVAHTVEKKGA